MAYPDKCRVVAIAEPLPETRKAFTKAHGIDDTLAFTTWEHLLEASEQSIVTADKRLADAVLVTVQDQMHLQVAAPFARQGYHILCEKPMATTIEECIAMEEVVKQAGVIFGMGHGRNQCFCRLQVTMELILNRKCSNAILTLYTRDIRDHRFWISR